MELLFWKVVNLSLMIVSIASQTSEIIDGSVKSIIETSPDKWTIIKQILFQFMLNIDDKISIADKAGRITLSNFTLHQTVYNNVQHTNNKNSNSI